MGQALRRATGRVKISDTKSPTRSYPEKVQNPEPSVTRATVEFKDPQSTHPNNKNWDSEVDPNVVPNSNTLEQKDQDYDVMLNELLGRVRMKSAPTVEMGEGIVMQRKRPLPKLKTSADTGQTKDGVLAPGTIDVAQLRQILLLHKGKAENQEKPLDSKSIAEKYRLDVATVQTILKYTSLPESDTKEEKPN